MRTRFLARAFEAGATRSMRRAASTARPASMIPHPTSALQPPDRRAVSLIRRIFSGAERNGLSSPTSAARAATCGAAIEVPWRYPKRGSAPRVLRHSQPKSEPPDSRGVALAGKVETSPGGPFTSSANPYALSEICGPRPVPARRSR